VNLNERNETCHILVLRNAELLTVRLGLQRNRPMIDHSSCKTYYIGLHSVVGLLCNLQFQHF